MTFCQVLKAIKVSAFDLSLDQHPYILPADHVGIYKDKLKLFVTRDLSSKGSLKDLIYKATPTKKPYMQKYELVDKNGVAKSGQALTVQQIGKYGNQILQALVFLKSIKFPFPHLHTCNVILNKDGNCWYEE